MNRVKHIILLISAALTISVTAATEAKARAITEEYNRANQLWLSEMSMAPDLRSREMIIKKRPNPADYGKRLRALISRDLAHPWTLKYGAWLLENETTIAPEPQHALLNAVEKNHLTSPLIGPFCIAMVNLNQGTAAPRSGQQPLRSRGMKILREIKKNNPDTKVQGQAALALSIMLASLGDDSRVMRERIKNLREAIIKSADVKVQQITVADIARDELYKMKNLSKGRIAPEITGTDSASRPIKLSHFRGKVIMLVFWSSWDKEAARSLEILRKSAASKEAKPFLILGVNKDSLLNLRALEADRLVTWRNFSDPNLKIAKAYRIAIWPYCMVLDKNGVIRYRGNLGSFADAVANDLLFSNKETEPAIPSR